MLNYWGDIVAESICIEMMFCQRDFSCRLVIENENRAIVPRLKQQKKSSSMAPDVLAPGDLWCKPMNPHVRDSMAVADPISPLSTFTCSQDISGLSIISYPDIISRKQNSYEIPSISPQRREPCELYTPVLICLNTSDSATLIWRRTIWLDNTQFSTLFTGVSAPHGLYIIEV